MRPFLALLTLLLLAVHPAAAETPGRWVGTWASAQLAPDAQNSLAPGTLENATLRQWVRTSIGGPRLRIRLSNAFGNAPLQVSGVHVAVAARLTGGIDPRSDRAVTFSGLGAVTIPAGAEYVSDPVSLTVPPLATLAVSMHLPQQQAAQTGHPGARGTSHIAAGNHLSAAVLPSPVAVDRWYHLAGIDVEAPAARAVAILGDSITDGYGIPPNSNTRWPDFLAQRLQTTASTRGLGVLNLGIGGNRLLLDGTGPNAVARFDRDVLARAGVSHVILLVGVNDLGSLTRDAPVSGAEHLALVERMIAAYRQIVLRARERGIKVIGATILPYGGSEYYHPDAANEADRAAINAWLRKAGNVDGLIDFDLAMRDPARPNRMLAEYDSGDGLHPSVAGYRAMAEAVPLVLFSRPKRKP